MHQFFEIETKTTVGSSQILRQSYVCHCCIVGRSGCDSFPYDAQWNITAGVSQLSLYSSTCRIVVVDAVVQVKLTHRCTVISRMQDAGMATMRQAQYDSWSCRVYTMRLELVVVNHKRSEHQVLSRFPVRAKDNLCSTASNLSELLVA